MYASLCYYNRARQWQQALALLEAMKADGVKPNIKLMSGAIAACTRGGQGHIALSLLDDMIYKLGLKPDVLCYTNVIKASYDEGRVSEAEELIARMEAAGLQLNRAKLQPVEHVAAVSSSTSSSDNDA
jgi:pentatricopeptide repeat protein